MTTATTDDSMVAQDAPATPMSRLKMKIGSRMRRFIAAVAMFITVDSPAFPSPLSIPARTLLRIRKGQRT